MEISGLSRLSSSIASEWTSRQPLFVQLGAFTKMGRVAHVHDTLEPTGADRHAEA